jgi:hypothetical protein
MELVHLVINDFRQMYGCRVFTANVAKHDSTLVYYWLNPNLSRFAGSRITLNGEREILPILPNKSQYYQYYKYYQINPPAENGILNPKVSLGFPARYLT